MPTTKHLFWPIIDLQGPFLLPNTIIYIIIDRTTNSNWEKWLKTDSTSTFFVFSYFIDRKLIHNQHKSIKESFLVPWYQIQIRLRVIWGSWTLQDYHFYSNLIIFSNITRHYPMSILDGWNGKCLYEKLPNRMNIGPRRLQKCVDCIPGWILMLLSSSI